MQGRRLLRRLAPSRRSVAVGLGILAFGLGAYAMARETSMFALDRIEVHGGTPAIDAQVRKALGPLVGTSLVGLDGSAVVGRVEALPTVVSASYDRAFPHTLRVTVVPERPAAVVRRGADAWLVSARGRVIEGLTAHAQPELPRIWLGRSEPLAIGRLLASTRGGTAAHALGSAGSFGRRVESAAYSTGSLVFKLRTGLELLLGSPVDIRLKLAVAASVLPQLPAGDAFLDVSVPGRPVAGSASDLAAEQQTSTTGLENKPRASVDSGR